MFGRAAAKPREERIPYYPKQLFQTSFGPVIEYLLIPADKTPGAKFDPNDPTKMFFNGIMLHFSQYSLQLPRFTEKYGLPGLPRHNLLLFNDPGHGNSTLAGLDSGTYLSGCGRAACELALSLGISKVDVVTQSMGTLVDLEFEPLFSAAGGKVGRRLFISPVLSDPKRVSYLARAVSPQVNSIRSALSREDFASFVANTLKLFSSLPFMLVWYGQYSLLARNVMPYHSFSNMIKVAIQLDAKTFVMAYDSMVLNGDRIGARLAEMPGPVRVILGANDLITDPKLTRRLIEELKPDARITELSRCLHWANSERPRSVNEVMADFFDQRWCPSV